MAKKEKMNFFQKFFGGFDPEDTAEEEFLDPAEVDEPKPKKKKAENECPWGPFIPSDWTLVVEVPRAGKKEPDKFTLYEYYRILWKESGGQPSADINKMVRSRVKSGDIRLVVYALNPNGKTIGPVTGESWTEGAIEAYHRAYDEAVEKLEAEREEARRRSKEASAKAEKAKRDKERDPEEARLERVEKLIKQARTLDFSQKKELVEMFKSILSEDELLEIMSAEPEDGSDTGESTPAPVPAPPAPVPLTPADGDPFADDAD